jgi:hypothetical protein
MAVQNITAAIQMIGFRINSYSVHLITMSADEVVISYAASKQIALSYDPPRIIKPEFMRDWYALKKKASNFFKHADRDPDAQYDGPDHRTLQRLNDYNLAFAIIGLQTVGYEIPPLLSQFAYALLTFYPDLAKWDEIFTDQPEFKKQWENIRGSLDRRGYECVVQLLCEKAGINDIGIP